MSKLKNKLIIKATAFATFIAILITLSGCGYENKQTTPTKNISAKIVHIPHIDSDISWKNSKLDKLKIGNELILVNYEYKIDDSVKSSNLEIVSAYKTVPLSSSDIELNSNALKAIKLFFQDAEKNGIDTLFVNSGYRSSDRQRELFEEADNNNYVQKAGHSEHQTGLSADIAIKGVQGKNMKNTEEGRWMEENSWKYGLILRYPENKESVTKINYEPWHFRYIGQPHATFCYENDMCYEEYIDYLKLNKEYQISIDNDVYNVFYKTPKDGIIQTPVDADYNASYDNTGGVIYTVKR